MKPETAIEPNVRQAVPFFGVTDIEQSVRFYVDGLGFKKTKEWTPEGKLRWCWLELDDAAIMLQEFWRDGPHTTGRLIAATCRQSTDRTQGDEG